MPRSITTRTLRTRLDEDAIIVPVFLGTRKLPAAAAVVDGGLDGVLASLLAAGFSGRRGETRVASVRRGRRLRHAVLLGLGDRNAVTAETLADAAGAAGTALGGRAPAVAIVLDDALKEGAEPGAVAHALVKGLALAGYSYTVGKERPSRLRRIVVVSAHPGRALTAALRRARLVSDLVDRVRDWVNAPANRMTPAVFADESRKLCASHGVACRVWRRADIEKARMGALLGVAEGSREEPRFVIMQYNMGAKKLPLVCLAGKGVTFDTGGISIKPWEKMSEMKGDMAGGGAVVAAVAACAALKLPLRVVGLVPCVENMPGGGAFRPGDVLTACSGKTIEVLTTDAEGRLILADAVAFAHAHYKPDVIVDIATLTGGVIVALGSRVAAVMGSSRRHVLALEDAGRLAGEPVWELPLDDYYFEMVKGNISDFKNYAGRNASPITGGAMIGAFAGTSPWVHVDIAGTGWNDGTGPSYQPRGATGYGVDLLLRYLEIIAATEL